MKRFFACTAILLAALTMSAQGHQAQMGHLKFYGLPMDGSLEVFSDSLINNRGFEKSFGRINILNGHFMDMKCHVQIFSSDKYPVNSLTVYFDESYTNWGALKSAFHSIESIYTEKYGSAFRVRKFTDPYKEGDGQEYNAVKSDNVEYYDTWKLPEGEITLRMGYDTANYYCILIMDYVNKKLKKTK
jgi:hypothetical protein